MKHKFILMRCALALNIKYYGKRKNDMNRLGEFDSRIEKLMEEFSDISYCDMANSLAYYSAVANDRHKWQKKG